MGSNWGERILMLRNLDKVSQPMVNNHTDSLVMARLLNMGHRLITLLKDSHLIFHRAHLEMPLLRQILTQDNR